MFEKWRISEHMEVADCNGRHVGTVDEIDGDDIKLTRSDSSDGQHHRIPVDAVDRIEDNRVYLKEGTPLPTTGITGETAMAGESASGGFSSQQDMTGGQQTTGAGYGSSQTLGSGTNAADNDAPFGTSGHGTGFGGSGAAN